MGFLSSIGNFFSSYIKPALSTIGSSIIKPIKAVGLKALNYFFPPSQDVGGPRETLFENTAFDESPVSPASSMSSMSSLESLELPNPQNSPAKQRKKKDVVKTAADQFPEEPTKAQRKAREQLLKQKF